MLESERLKGLKDCRGKLYFPSLLMFWEHLSNRVLTSQFQETDSGSGFTVVVFEVYACLEPHVRVCFPALCVSLVLKYLVIHQGPQETKMALHSSPHMFQLHVSSSFLSLIASCHVQRIWLWQLARASSKLWLCLTHLSPRKPLSKHILGAIPAVHYRCCWLVNEGDVTLRDSRGRLADRKTTLSAGHLV